MQALFILDSEASPPSSPLQPAPPMPSHSPKPAPATPTPTNDEQTHAEGTLGNQIGLHNRTLSYYKTTLDDDKYLDFSVTSDTDDDDDAVSSNDGLDDVPNTNDDLDHTEMGMHADDEHGYLLTQLEITKSQESWVEPTIVHYPGNRAGEVCSEGIMVMQEFENALGGPSENPYSPFGSQVDWELAKWVKLCGPSATSFTELLNIGGVSMVNKPLCFIILLPLSSCMNN